MEDDLEAQLVQQLAEKEQREWEARLKVEHEAQEKATWEARERAEREAQEREYWENEYRARYQEEEQRKHKAAAQRVAEGKQIQCQVRMPEASRSRRNGDAEVSSPSPSPAYIRLIRRQAAQVSGSEMEFFLLVINGIRNREKPGASGKALVVRVSPVGSLASVRTARHCVMGARNGRSRATCLGGSHAGRRRNGKADPLSIPMRMRRASQSRSGGKWMQSRWWRSSSQRRGHCPFSRT